MRTAVRIMFACTDLAAKTTLSLASTMLVLHYHELMHISSLNHLLDMNLLDPQHPLHDVLCILMLNITPDDLSNLRVHIKQFAPSGLSDEVSMTVLLALVDEHCSFVKGTIVSSNDHFVSVPDAEFPLLIDLIADIYNTFVDEQYFRNLLELFKQDRAFAFKSGLKRLEHHNHKVSINLVSPRERNSPDDYFGHTIFHSLKPFGKLNQEGVAESTQKVTVQKLCENFVLDFFWKLLEHC